MKKSFALKLCKEFLWSKGACLSSSKKNPNMESRHGCWWWWQMTLLRQKLVNLQRVSRTGLTFSKKLLGNSFLPPPDLDLTAPWAERDVWVRARLRLHLSVRTWQHPVVQYLWPPRNSTGDLFCNYAAASIFKKCHKEARDRDSHGTTNAAVFGPTQDSDLLYYRRGQTECWT